MKRIIFDRDGVLHRDPKVVLENVLDSFGNKYRITKDQIVGNGYVIPEHLFKTEQGLEIQKRFQTVYLAQKISKDGIKRLEKFKKMGSLEILTYNPKVDILREMLTASQAEHFFDSINFCDRNHPNQSKLNYLKLIRGETNSNVDIVFITDTLSDLEEARDSEINTILYFVSEGWNIPKEVFDLVDPKNIMKPFYS
ncbi:MAG: phosphoglycolate phosphatase-like HAD superfamily hydrolase [Candidatus Paceibacteria bacterium]|jgi:phosphoglycolate phosphatase-like HAD superfamily hydrolase